MAHSFGYNSIPPKLIVTGQAKRDLNWDLARNGSREAAALRPFSRAHGNRTKVIVNADMQCPSLLAND